MRGFMAMGKRVHTQENIAQQAQRHSSDASKSRNSSNAQAGLSLLELVIYIATASIVLFGIVALFTMLANSWVRVQARARVEEGARLAVERLRYEIESAQSVITPSPGALGASLLVDTGSLTRNYSGYAWSENAGWISFGCTDSDGTVSIDDCTQTDPALDDYRVSNSFDRLSGYANTETSGGVLFDCADSGSMTSCQTADFQVTVDASGDWHGWAYSEGFGWISMNCENTGACFAAGTTANPCGGDDGNWRVCEIWDTSGVGMAPVLEVHGWAWSDSVGWISFNAEDRSGTCTTDPFTSTNWCVTAPTNNLLNFGVDVDMTGGQLYIQEAGGANQFLTDDDVDITSCSGWGTDYFRVVANPSPARSAVTLCFSATYVGAGVGITSYSTEVQTTFELR